VHFVANFCVVLLSHFCILYFTTCTVTTAVEMNQNGDYGTPVPDYIDENVSTKVVKIIQSYTGVVNRMVWRK
jgi:UDP-N-acetylglucosamine 2-epimerase